MLDRRCILRTSPLSNVYHGHFIVQDIETFSRDFVRRFVTAVKKEIYASSYTFIARKDNLKIVRSIISNFLFLAYISRPYNTHDIEEALDQDERYSSGTLTPDDKNEVYTYHHFSSSVEEQRSTLPIHQLEGSTTHAINVLGSLLLRSISENDPRLEDQGIYQGLMMGDHHRDMMDVFPNALCMTVNLEQHQAELEGLSVRVTRETEIVPRTPFDMDISKARKRYSG